MSIDYKRCPHVYEKHKCDQYREYNTLCGPAHGCFCPVIEAKRNHIKKIGHRKSPGYLTLVAGLLAGKF
jgi:hypothetical protein